MAVYTSEPKLVESQYFYCLERWILGEEYSFKRGLTKMDFVNSMSATVNSSDRTGLVVLVKEEIPKSVMHMAEESEIGFGEDSTKRKLKTSSTKTTKRNAGERNVLLRTY